jgi:hypothetical protein
LPVAGWFAAKDAKLRWGAGPSDAVSISVRTVTWWSPIFDLRPEFRGATPNAPQPHIKAAAAATLNQQTVGNQTIWRPGGAGGQLSVNVSNLNGDPTWLNDLVVSTREFSSPVDPNPRVVTTPQDVTSYFAISPPQDSIDLTFGPLGYPYPVRFWRVAIIFDKLVDEGDPGFIINASYV